MKRRIRYGFTKSGKRVPLRTLIPADGGSYSWVLNDAGVAVLCFIPHS